MDANWNSAYPYVVGPTFYGNVTATKVTSVTETTNTYASLTSILKQDYRISIYPNPATGLVAIQVNGLVHHDLQVSLSDVSGRQVGETEIRAGQTIAYFDLQTLYNGVYTITIKGKDFMESRKLIVSR